MADEVETEDPNAKSLFIDKGNGDFRPRIAQYPEIQDALGTAVNAALVGNGDPKSVLDDAQAKAEKLFK